MKPFENKFLTPAEGDVVFGTNGIRRKPNYMGSQPYLGLTSLAPESANPNPEDVAMQPLIDKGTEDAIIPGPEAEMDIARGEPTPAPADSTGDLDAIQSIVNNPALPEVIEKLKLAKQHNPAFGPAFRAAYQATIAKQRGQSNVPAGGLQGLGPQGQGGPR
jgi:hypothetical protein